MRQKVTNYGAPRTNARNFNDYFVKRQNFALDTGYYSYLNKCIYNLQSYYDTSRQKKKRRKLGYYKSANFVKVHVIDY